MSNTQLNFAGLFRATVLSAEGNIAHVRIESGHVPQNINVTLLSPFGGQVPTPAINSTGIILVQGETGVWLGSTSVNDEDAAQPNPGIQLNSEDNLSSVRITRENVSMGNTHFHLNSTPEQLDIKQVKSTLTLTNSRFQLLVNENETGLSIGLDAIHLENKNQLNFVGGSKINLCSRGPIVLSGGIHNSSETDEYRRLSPAGKIIGKASEIKLGSGGLFSVDAGKLHINVTSSVVSGGPLPGTGGLDAFTLNLIQGNALVSSALGNIEMYAMGLPNYVRLKAGAIFDLIYSQLNLTRAGAVLTNTVGGAIHSTLDLKFGDAELSATKNINIDALMKTIIGGKTGIELNTLTNIDLSALLNIRIEGKVKIELKTAVLDLKNAKIIDAGPKTVAPTGSGPFCGIPACVFSGSPHTGNKAIG